MAPDLLYRPPIAAQPPAPPFEASPAPAEPPTGLLGALATLALGCGALSLFLLAAAADAFDRWSDTGHLECCESQSFVQVAILGSLTATGACIAATAARAAAACTNDLVVRPDTLIRRLRTLLVTAAVGAVGTVVAILAALAH